jgi:putative peptide zinc metalloprotease protein
MRGQLEQDLWSIKTSVRRDLVITRQVLRGAGRYVVHDPITFRNHIFDALEYRIMMCIVPTRTLAEAFDRLVDAGDLEEGDTNAFHDFVVSLHGMGLLQIPADDAAVLHGRNERRSVARRRGSMRHLIYLKIPFFDPDRFLDRTVGLFGKAFSKWGVALWACLVAAAIWKCWGRAGEMFAESSNLLSLGNIPVLFVALTALKIIHEFGHAYACKRFGCEVPEMGMVFIFLTPCAYVDAGASWKLASRWQRIGIGLGGMYVESAIAAVFALIWAGTQPGQLHDVAVNVVVLASLVTLLFNINPLMRFDGYFVFTDLLGMPNLFERSRQFFGYRAKQFFLGLSHMGRRHDDENPSRFERALYGWYGVAAFVYKIFLAVAIVAMVFTGWPLVGALIGCAFAYMFLLRPVLKLVHYLLMHEETASVRGRARILALGGLVALPALAGFVPLSFRVIAPGVLEPANAVVLHTGTDGFVKRIDATEGRRVRAGQSIARLANDLLALELVRAEARSRTEQIRLEAAELTDPVEAEVLRARLGVLDESVDRLRRRVGAMSVGAPHTGTVSGCAVEVGDFVRRGQPIAELHSGAPTVRVVLTDTEVDRAHLAVGDEVALRFRVQPEREVKATIRAILPSASREAIPRPLTVLGGGTIYGTSRSGTALTADRSYLHVLVEPDWIPAQLTGGLTAAIRFEARPMTLGSWLFHRLASFYNAWRMT